MISGDIVPLSVQSFRTNHNCSQSTFRSLLTYLSSWICYFCFVYSKYHLPIHRPRNQSKHAVLESTAPFTRRDSSVYVNVMLLISLRQRTPLAWRTPWHKPKPLASNSDCRSVIWIGIVGWWFRLVWCDDRGWEMGDGRWEMGPETMRRKSLGFFVLHRVVVVVVASSPVPFFIVSSPPSPKIAMDSSGTSKCS